MIHKARIPGGVLAATIGQCVLAVWGCSGPGSSASSHAADLGEMVVPADNPQTDEKVSLGHQLFFDERLSVDGTRACYTCHRNEHGNGGGEPTAIGALNRQLTRHSPVIWNVGYMKSWYWDGRAASLEAQATGAWSGGNMGVGRDALAAKAREIGGIAGYQEQFARVFPDRGVTPETVVQAIAAYERTLVCNDTRYDRFVSGDNEALTSQEKAGLDLFLGKAACATCHTPPFFSNQFATAEGAYFNTGIGIEGKPEADIDAGRVLVSEQEPDWGAFKTPSLRNVSKSAPYFHDGSAGTLEAAVRFMAGGGYPNRNLSPLLMDRALTDEEVTLIVAFLGALECGSLEIPELP